MAIYNGKHKESSIEEARVSFIELQNAAKQSQRKPKFIPITNQWYDGVLSEIVLTKSVTKGYPCIAITFSIPRERKPEDKETKYDKIIINHILSNLAGPKSLREIKRLLSILGVSNQELNTISNIETEYKFVEYLQKFVGTPIRIKSTSDSSTKSYDIERRDVNNGK